MVKKHKDIVKDNKNLIQVQLKNGELEEYSMCDECLSVLRGQIKIGTWQLMLNDTCTKRLRFHHWPDVAYIVQLVEGDDAYEWKTLYGTPTVIKHNNNLMFGDIWSVTIVNKCHLPNKTLVLHGDVFEVLERCWKQFKNNKLGMSKVTIVDTEMVSHNIDFDNVEGFSSDVISIGQETAIKVKSVMDDKPKDLCKRLSIPFDPNQHIFATDTTSPSTTNEQADNDKSFIIHVTISLNVGGHKIERVIVTDKDKYVAFEKELYGASLNTGMIRIEGVKENEYLTVQRRSIIDIRTRNI